MRHLLLVEDDNGLRDTMRDYFSLKGYRISEAATGSDFEKTIGRDQHDLILLDLNLPDSDGLHLLGRLREYSTTPIFVVSGRADEFSRITALDLRADDYVVKPFNIRELELRIRNIIERRKQEQPAANSLWFFGRNCFDTSRNTLTEQGGERVNLSRSETELLKLLLVADGGVVSSTKILSHFGSINIPMTPESLPVIVSRLRAKLHHGPTEQIIANMQGQGYYIAVPLKNC